MTAVSTPTTFAAIGAVIAGVGAIRTWGTRATIPAIASLIVSDHTLE
jgi:hypothetical protein